MHRPLRLEWRNDKDIVKVLRVTPQIRCVEGNTALELTQSAPTNRSITQRWDSNETLDSGGTVFLGRHIVEAALDRVHQVTLFNRGRTNPDLFPNVERLRGDRDGNLGALKGRTWDGVIDTSGYVPRLVRASADLLKDAVAHYSFISSISVYADRQKLGIAENAPLHTLEDTTTEEVNAQTYGGLKVLCEQAVEAVMPGRSFLVRLGLLVGPHDPTGRFTYWVERMADGWEVLVPGPSRASGAIHRCARCRFLDRAHVRGTRDGTDERDGTQ